MTNSNRETKAKELLLRWIIEESISDKSAPEIEEKLRSHLFDILLAATTLSIFCAYNLYKLISKMLDGTGHYALNIVLCIFFSLHIFGVIRRIYFLTYFVETYIPKNKGLLVALSFTAHVSIPAMICLYINSEGFTL